MSSLTLDLSADMGHEFKIVGARWCGGEGRSCDYWYMDGEEFVDEFTPMIAGHVRTDLAPVATYVPESIWVRMEHY